MTIGVSTDSMQHLPELVVDYLREKGHEVMKYAACAEPEGKFDYIDAAEALAEAVADGICDQGILFCNTGTGVSIVANKVSGVRAALCVDEFSAEIARIANNANVLILSMRLTGDMLARQILDKWFATDPSQANDRRLGLHRKTQEFDLKHRGSNE